MELYQETKVIETKNEEGIVVERITEEWVEKKPLELKQRVLEKVAPVVLERKTETYVDDKIVNTQIEVPEGLNLTSKNFVDIEPDPIVAPVVVNNNLNDVFYTVVYSIIILEVLWLGYYKIIPLFL